MFRTTRQLRTPKWRACLPGRVIAGKADIPKRAVGHRAEGASVTQSAVPFAQFRADFRQYVLQNTSAMAVRLVFVSAHAWLQD
jgi:hypothetical protein